MVTSEVLQFFQTQWEEYIKHTANKLKGEFYQHKAGHIIMINDCEYVGSSEEFATYVLNRFGYMDNSINIVYERLAKNEFKKIINTSQTRKYAKLGLNFNGRVNMIHFELFHDLAPRTCANFLQLCAGFRRSDGEVLRYHDTEVNRIVKGMFIQMGKITPSKNPELGTSIYGGAFEDESFAVKHEEVGMLGMCKRNG